MVLLTVTPTISSALRAYFDSIASQDDTTQDTQSVLSLPSIDDYRHAISHSDLTALANQPSTTTSLASLVKGTSVYFQPKPAPPPKTKEYIDLMANLRLRQQEAEYQSLLSSDLPTKSKSTSLNNNPDEEDITPGKAMKELREQLATIVNVAVTVGSVATAAWWWSGTSTHWSVGVRTLVAIFAAILVLVAEASVYLGYRRRVEEAKVVERGRKEKKEIVSTYRVGAAQETIKTSEKTTVVVGAKGGTKASGRKSAAQLKRRT